MNRLCGMKQAARVLAALSLAIAVLGPIDTARADHQYPEGWRLPFDGIIGNITNAPGWETHVGQLFWDIDYDVGEIPVRAPADGTVWQLTTDCQGPCANYGAVVVLQHEGTYSIYLHLRVSSIAGLYLGQPIRQGEQFAIVSNTGGPYGVHLHFGAREGMVRGGGVFAEIASGTSIPTLSMPGNWFRSCYTPPIGGPVANTCGLVTSRVTSPVTSYVPTYPGMRHLANDHSPIGSLTDTHSFYAGPVNQSDMAVHQGVSPNSSSSATFGILELDYNTGNWNLVYSDTGPVFQFVPGAYANVLVSVAIDGPHSTWAAVAAVPPDVTTDAPHVAAAWGFAPEFSHAVLEYKDPRWTYYSVFEVYYDPSFGWLGQIVRDGSPETSIHVRKNSGYGIPSVYLVKGISADGAVTSEWSIPVAIWN